MNNKGKAIVYEHTSKQDHEIEIAHQIVTPFLAHLENNKMCEDSAADGYIWNSSAAEKESLTKKKYDVKFATTPYPSHNTFS